MFNSLNILLVGVGGQGTILMSKIISAVFLNAGLDVKMAEIHGMSQRGGSVSTQIRVSKQIFSPVIETGTADIIVAFEKSEALRWLHYLKKEGSLIVNDHAIQPFTVSLGISSYPDDVMDTYRRAIHSLHTLNASSVAAKLGNAKTMNLVLLGAFVRYLRLEAMDWKGVIESTVPSHLVSINLKAFEAGYAINPMSK